MIKNNRVINEVDRFAMMVNDDHGFDLFQQRRIFHKIRPVRIHHHKQRTLAQKLQSVARLHNEIPHAALIKLADQCLCKRLAARHNDICRLFEKVRCAPHTDRSAQSIQVGESMAHN